MERRMVNRSVWLGVLAALLAIGMALPSAAAPVVPASEQLRPLVTTALLDFNEAIQKKDFTAFHGKASKLLAEKISADDMLKAFDDFVKKDVNIEGIRDLDPDFDPKPEIDENGVLVVSGRYPTTPYKVLFTLKYLSERQGGKEQWKVVGLSVDVKRIPAPAEAELRKMATQTLLDFNAGVKSKDFKPFLATTAKAFQEQFTSDKLLDAFKDFVEKEVDVSTIKGVDPIFDKPPAFGEDKENGDAVWVLSLEGHYPTPDIHVFFSLKYLPDGTGWKLISIDVNTKKAE